MLSVLFDMVRYTNWSSEMIVKKAVELFGLESELVVRIAVDKLFQNLRD